MNLLARIPMMYITLLPAIVAGVVNSIFCKVNTLSKFKVPIDFEKKFIDGKRIFGENKTWKGLFGYIFFNVIFMVIWGVICNLASLNNLNFFYFSNENTILNNLLFGSLVGLFYALFELPNSFLKRRLGIEPRKTSKRIFKDILYFFGSSRFNVWSMFGGCYVL